MSKVRDGAMALCAMPTYCRPKTPLRVQVVTVEQYMWPCTLSTGYTRLAAVVSDGVDEGAMLLEEGLRRYGVEGMLQPYAVVDVVAYVAPSRFANNLPVLAEFHYVGDAGAPINGSPVNRLIHADIILENLRVAEVRSLRSPLGLSAGVLARTIIDGESPIYLPVLQVFALDKTGIKLRYAMYDAVWKLTVFDGCFDALAYVNPACLNYDLLNNKLRPLAVVQIRSVSIIAESNGVGQNSVLIHRLGVIAFV